MIRKQSEQRLRGIMLGQSFLHSHASANDLRPGLVEQVVRQAMHPGLDGTRDAFAAAEIEEARHVAEDEIEAVVFARARRQVREKSRGSVRAEKVFGYERSARARRRAALGGVRSE